MTNDQLHTLAQEIIITSPVGSKQFDMAVEIQNSIGLWDMEKANRWLGYAQCLQVACGERSLKRIIKDTRKILKGKKDV